MECQQVWHRRCTTAYSCCRYHRWMYLPDRERGKMAEQHNCLMHECRGAGYAPTHYFQGEQDQAWTAGSSTYRIYDPRICNRIYQWKTVSGIWRAFCLIFNREENLSRKQQSPVTTGHAQITSFQFGIHGIHEVKECWSVLFSTILHTHSPAIRRYSFCLIQGWVPEAIDALNRLMCGQRISRVTFFRVLVPAYTGAMTPEAIRIWIQEYRSVPPKWRYWEAQANNHKCCFW